MKKYDVFVIGSGMSGMTAANKCASKGLKVGITDELPYGGTCALRICIEITCPFLLVLLLAHCVENTRHSYGYACVFRLVVKQNNCL